MLAKQQPELTADGLGSTAVCVGEVFFGAGVYTGLVLRVGWW